MILEPKAVVLYVDNITTSSKFYQDLFEIHPEESSPTFHSFQFSSGMVLGLKTKHAVEPPPDKNGSGELVFTLDTNRGVDELFIAWQKKGIIMALQPTSLTYGYSFLALDPDGNRLRVVCIGQS